MTEIFDPIRNNFFPALPEEKVRQALLRKMIKELDYPKNYICVEKDLKSLPHLNNKPLPLKRRADIICFAKDDLFSIYPLLMIECKAHPLSEKVKEQIIGYNYYVKAYFIAICNQDEIKTFYYDKKVSKYICINFLPTYFQLIKSIKRKI